MKLYHSLKGALLLMATVLTIQFTSCSKEEITPLTPEVKTDASETAVTRNSDVMKARLDGFQMVPVVQTAARAQAHFAVGSGESYLKYGIYASHLADAVSAELYFGDIGETGVFVANLPLYVEQIPAGTYTGILGEGQIFEEDLAGPLEGDFDLLIRALKRHKIYIMVRTLQNPDGEIRGHLAH